MVFLFVAAFAIHFSLASTSDFTNSDPRSGLNEVGALLNHLKTTEAVVQQLLRRVEHLETQNEAHQRTILSHLGRVEQLETRNNDQQQLILNLRSELAMQRQHTGSLERICKVNCQYVGKEKGISQTENKKYKGLPIQSMDGIINKTYVEEKGMEDQKVSGYDTSRIRRADNEENIAFFATLSNHFEHAGVQQTFVFDRIVTNLGHGYNNVNGNFIAPVSGTYVFSATLISLYHQNSHSQFTKNGQAVSYMYVSGAEAGYDTTSQTIVVQLQKGDSICIRNIDANTSYHGAHYSTFSGFLLQQDYMASTAVGKK